MADVDQVPTLPSDPNLVSPDSPPSNPLLSDHDPIFTASLRRERNTGGSLRKIKNAFSTTKTKVAVPMPGLQETDIPWFAVSIVGPTNQLQIIDPYSASPAHVITVPKSHNGGLESLLWDEQNLLLYLSTKGNLLVWDSRKPKQIHTIGAVPQATTLYELNLDSAGNVWGGAYPNGAPFSYRKSTGKIRAYPRLAADTDYVRRVVVDERDQVWLGTGSRNPRIFTHTTTKPLSRTEIKLPQPMENGFISSLSVIGDFLAVSASNIPEQLVLDRAQKSWVNRLERMWSERRVSTSKGLDPEWFYSVTSGYLYAINTVSWADRKLGPVASAAPLCIYATRRHVLVFSEDANGIKIEFFELRTNSVARTQYIRLSTGAFAIQSLLGLSDGKVMLGGYMGSGIATIDLVTGRRWSSPDSQDVVNQVEGMIEFDQSRIYLGSYGGADIISLDTRQRNNVAGYQLLDRLGRKYDQSRPFAWATNSQYVFFGTVPDYGLSGGAIGQIDPVSNEILWVLNGGGEGFVSSQSIVGLDADEQYLYGTTSGRNGYGIPDSSGPASIFKMDIKSKKIVWITTPVPDASALYAPKIVAGWIVCADAEGINVIDAKTGKVVKRHRLTNTKNSDVRAGWTSANLVLVAGGAKVVHSASNTTSVVDFQNGSVALIGSATAKERYGTRLAVTPDGEVFGIYKRTTLVQLDLEPRRPKNKPLEPKNTKNT
ncbi:hypothetical protein ACTXJX_07020 [Glutamicibacter ardleyensis]|uniref:hypothetical protein n=1 Tax=Glutamicibacter ardleyensis TaxID=225894 RepID=UPI003FD5A9A1